MGGLLDKTIAQVQTNKKGYYTLLFHDGDTLQVSEDVMIRHRLLKGTVLTEADFLKIQGDSQLDLGYQRALVYLNYQMRTEKEVWDYLAKQEIDVSSRPKIIARLKELHLLDDVSYGESYVRTMMRTSDKGPKVVAQKLRQKGIKQEVVDQVLPLFTEETEQEIASHVAEKALVKYQRKSHKEQIQKTRLFLMTKGFTSEVIDQVMANLSVEKDPEEELDLLRREGEKLWRKHERKELPIRKQKTLQSLYQKGFDMGMIQEFIGEKELEDEED